MPRTAPVVGLALILAACATPGTPPPPAPAAPASPLPATRPLAQGIDPSIVDRSVSPCVDFYAYACGEWIRNTEIPADKSRWVRSFDVMREDNKERLHGVLESAAAGKVDPQDRFGQKVADLYAGCMDEEAVEASGLAQLREEWKRIDAVKDGPGLAAAVGRLHAQGAFPLFSVRATQDAKDSRQVIGNVVQGGLSLPDRDYYVKKDDRSDALRRDFLAHVERQLVLAGEPVPQAAADATAILGIESALAESAWTRVEMRDPNRVYNRLDLVGLRKAAPSFDWDGYLAALGAAGVSTFNASTPRELARIDELVRTTPPAAWRAYLRWHALAQAADLRALPRAMSEEAFWFQARHFSGEKAMQARWKHCVDVTDRLLGEALGQSFARRFFAGDARAKALSLVVGVQGAMGQRLSTVDWMDDATRARASEKLAAVNNKIGYPERWRDYSDLQIRRDAFLASALSASAFEVRRQIGLVGKPVDRAEWRMSTPTVNAYYSPPLNEIVFPAGILQPPLYTQGANDAVNYGAIGLVVGHELTHGFDDQGRQYDARGNLSDWWSPPVGAEFVRRASCVERQYSEYTAVEEVKLNGKLTLGENLADLGGLRLSLAAYQASRRGLPPEPPVGGYTPEQQFFLAHAQAWCAIVRPENVRLRAVTDPHSPPRWRVNGPLSNVPEFAEAFQCKAGDPMVRAIRCEVW